MRCAALVLGLLCLGCRLTPAPSASLGSSPLPSTTPLPTPTPLPLSPALTEKLSDAASRLRAQDASALTALLALESDAKNSAVLSEQLAGLYEELDFTDKLYTLALQATRLDPQYSPGFVRLGRVEQYLGYFDQAEKHLREAVRLAPHSSDAQLAYGLYFQHEAKWPDAERCLKAACDADPATWQLAIVYSQILVQEGKFDLALQAIDTARKVAPDKQMLVFQRAITLAEQATALEKSGQGAQAAALRQEARPAAEQAILKLAQSGPSWFHLSKLRQAMGDQTGALEALEKAHALAPGYLNTRYVFAQALLRQGQRERAQKLLTDDAAQKRQSDRYQQLALGVGQAPDDSEKRRAFARYCQEHRLINRALFEWEQLLQRKPTDPEATQQVKTLTAQRLKDMTQ
ncbi:tetratricopeptide repeat protein [Armatimonas rosea]|uniref:Tetratricopeptide (TPR) repeat protein n=1 Tax=Armatimonas rosea TaxID=685828 RepID=A0A7W9SSX1_ARMRO|nr:tetratricopeptide repeat protein [Armatimonas rosea]MBB6052257.1 tetratricopeptide (TPR) repeat protein [Armatimonas rosea]